MIVFGLSFALSVCLTVSVTCARTGKPKNNKQNSNPKYLKAMFVVRNLEAI